VLPDDTRDVQADKREELDKIRMTIINGDATFAEMARAHSDCPSRDRGGDLGWFSREQMAPSFSQAAFSTPPGRISDIVRTEFGFHIIQVHEYRPERQAQLDEIRDDLGRYIHDQRKRSTIQTFIESVRGRANIEIKHIEP